MIAELVPITGEASFRVRTIALEGAAAAVPIVAPTYEETVEPE